MKIHSYIIGDVHGCLHTLQALIAQFPKQEDAHIILTGDLIGKGKYSAQVLDYIIKRGYQSVKGNHEMMMHNSYSLTHMTNTKKLSRLKHFWYENGGDTILESYDLPHAGDMMEHLLWIEKLPHYIEDTCADDEGRTLFVTHGFGLPYYQRRNEKSVELMTNRISKEVFSDYEKKYTQYPVFNVFGHDPHDEAIITNHYAVIDTGCVYHKASIPTKLTALEWPTKKLYQQAYID